MLVFKSTYDRMHVRALRAEISALRHEAAFDSLNLKWNKLVKRINKLGGENFLANGEAKMKLEIDMEDVKRLLMLCHPDKHDGKQMASDMTVKLLALKNRMENP